MKISFEGREWEFDESLIDVKQATVLWLTYKMTLSEWSAGTVELDQRALHFTYWLMLQQNGVVEPIADCNPLLVKFAEAYAGSLTALAAEAEAAKAAEAEADPTLPGPSLTPSPVSPQSATPTTTTRQHRDPQEAATAS